MDLQFPHILKNQQTILTELIITHMMRLFVMFLQILQILIIDEP